VGQRVTGLLWNGLAELGVAREDHLLGIDGPVLGEPLACAMNVLRRAGSADLVAFVGFGYLAALCAQLLPTGTRWIALSRRDESRALALSLGAEAAHPFDRVPPELWDTVPLVIEAAGVQQTLDYATWLTAYGGRLIVAGYHADGPRTVNMQSWNWKGIDVINAHDRQPDVFVRALRDGLGLVTERGLDLPRLQTHEFELNEAADAFRAAERHPAGFLKAVVRL
jgi:threonine dehydrogenase-like Zn-dependent dehydrogenase